MSLVNPRSVPPAKDDSTLKSSQAVPHPSTNRALCRLTSEVERDPVHSTRYGRQRRTSLTISFGVRRKPTENRSSDVRSAKGSRVCRVGKSTWRTEERGGKLTAPAPLCSPRPPNRLRKLTERKSSDVRSERGLRVRPRGKLAMAHGRKG